MATAKQIATFRRNVCKGMHPTFTKEQINSVYNAIDEWFNDNKSAIDAVISGASPHIFSNPQKKKIVAYYLESKFNQEK